MIDIVFDERNGIGQSQVLQGALDDLITGTIHRNQIDQGAAFRRCIFQMTHVQVDPPGVRQESPVARRLVVAPVMQIQHAALLSVEDVVANAVRDPRRGVLGAVLMDQKTVFGFEAEDLVEHGIPLIVLRES